MVERWEYESKDCRLLQGSKKNYRFLVAVVRYEISAYLNNFIEKYISDPRYKIVVKVAAYDNALLEALFHAAKTPYKSLHPSLSKRGYAFHGRVIFVAKEKEELQNLIARWINFANVTISFCVVSKDNANHFAHKQAVLAEKRKNGHPPEGCHTIVFLSGGFTDKLQVYYDPENQEIRQECKNFYQGLIVKYDLQK